MPFSRRMRIILNRRRRRVIRTPPRRAVVVVRHADRMLEANLAAITIVLLALLDAEDGDPATVLHEST